MKISKDINKTIVTYYLGSCIGMTAYDPLTKIAGMIHYMLPNSEVDRNRKCIRKFMFADTGIPMLIEGVLRMGADKRRLVVKIAGGGNMIDNSGIFSIGLRNYTAAKSILCTHSINVEKENIGGSLGRTLSLNVNSGDIFIRFSGKTDAILF